MKYSDWRGIEIKVGSNIIYPVSHSSNIELVEAYVKEIFPIEYKTNWNRKNRTFKLIVIPVARLRSGKVSYEIEDKEVIVTAVERVTVI